MPKIQNSPLPVTSYGSRGVIVPLEQAIQNPNTVLNTTPKVYLPQINKISQK